MLQKLRQFRSIHYMYFSFLVIFLVLLLLFPNICLIGSKSGLLLWFNVILPTLLPFLIISNLIVGLNLVPFLCYLFYKIFSPIIKLSCNAYYPILLCLLSGYPLSAKGCADLIKKNQLSMKEGQFLLSLCNNTSIMFMTGFVALQSLQDASLGIIIVMIIYCSSLLSSIIYFSFCSKKESIYSSISMEEISDKNQPPCTFIVLLDNSILNAFETMVKIGGYIMLFSISASLLTALLPNSTFLKFIVVGILEITNGIHFIAESNLSISSKLLFIIPLNAFGGLSSFVQTKSVIHQSGLSMWIYFKTKLLNAIIAFIITYVWVCFL